jgi:hypothetical protein
MITYYVQQLPKNICLEDLRNLMPKRALIDDLIRPRFVIKPPVSPKIKIMLLLVRTEEGLKGGKNQKVHIYCT